jgi:hypothetical protein
MVVTARVTAAFVIQQPLVVFLVYVQADGGDGTRHGFPCQCGAANCKGKIASIASADG